MTGRISQPSPFEINAGELRAIIQLAMEVRDFPPGDPAQRRHFLQGASTLVGAQVAMWLELDGLAQPRPEIVSGLDQGWSSPEQRANFLSYLDSQHNIPDPALPGIARAWQENRLITSTRRQLVTDRVWYQSDHVDRFRRGAGLDDFIYSIAPDSSLQSLGFHRPWGEKPYTERDRAVIYALHSECGRLFGDRLRDAKLSPRQHEVVRLLALGWSEKQVADKMDITVSTVHGYLKIAHKRLKVQSRAELLAVVAGWKK